MTFIRKIPLAPLAVIAIVLAIMPPAEPHLIQKLNMLAEGTLVKTIDWFDLAMHGVPLLVLLVRLIAEIPVLLNKNKAQGNGPGQAAAKASKKRRQ